MNVSVDVWLRGTDFATTEQIEGVTREPREWTEADVRVVIEGMLRAMDRSKRPGEADREISLRALSWIVNPFEEDGKAGVVIAIEITLGAAIAGPFDIDQKALETMIARVVAQGAQQAPPSPPTSTTVH